MKKRVLSLLGLMGLIIVGSFAWHRQHAQPLPPTAQVAGTEAQGTSPEALTLTQESIDALQADNSELQARIEALRDQQTDADQLIALKAARLATLEKSAQKP
ncbi:MAG: hypothetical protein AABY68_00110 [Pseudomonadota bacterium]